VFSFLSKKCVFHLSDLVYPSVNVELAVTAHLGKSFRSVCIVLLGTILLIQNTSQKMFPLNLILVFFGVFIHFLALVKTCYYFIRKIRINFQYSLDKKTSNNAQ
jgi:hypothetical protein